MHFFNFLGNLPYNVHMQAINAVEKNSNKLLVRLVNIFSSSEDTNIATVDLIKLFQDYKLQSIMETTLSANQGKKLLFFTFLHFTFASVCLYFLHFLNLFKLILTVLIPHLKTQITLAPAEIRTFIITFN